MLCPRFIRVESAPSSLACWKQGSAIPGPAGLRLSRESQTDAGFCTSIYVNVKHKQRRYDIYGMNTERDEWNRQRVSADDAQNRMCFSSSATHLSSVSGGENPHDPSALLHVPEKPEGRHLVGLRGHVHVDKQGGELAGVAWDKGERGREVNFAGKTTNNKKK